MGNWGDVTISTIADKLSREGSSTLPGAGPAKPDHRQSLRTCRRPGLDPRCPHHPRPGSRQRRLIIGLLEVDLASSNEPTRSQLFLAAVGERVMTFRETASLSPQVLSSRTGISVAYIRRLEMGQADPTVTRLERIAIVLGTTVMELLDVDGDELGLAYANHRSSDSTSR